MNYTSTSASSQGVGRYSYTIGLSLLMAATIARNSADTLREVNKFASPVGINRSADPQDNSMSMLSVDLMPAIISSNAETSSLSYRQYDGNEVLAALRRMGLEDARLAQMTVIPTNLPAGQSTGSNVAATKEIQLNDEEGDLDWMFDILEKYRGTFKAPEDWAQNHDQY